MHYHHFHKFIKNGEMITTLIQNTKRNDVESSTKNRLFDLFFLRDWLTKRSIKKIMLVWSKDTFIRHQEKSTRELYFLRALFVESNSDCYYKNFPVDSGTNRYRIIVAGKAVEIELLSASNIFYIAFLFYHFVFK